jgi:hypothetical protein
VTSRQPSKDGALSSHTEAKVAAVVAGRIAIITLLMCFALAFFGWGESLRDHPRGIKLVQAIVLCCWTLGVPIWFWIEFHWIGTTMENMEQLKYSQELSSKVWLAATSVLFLLYFWKDMK